MGVSYKIEPERRKIQIKNNSRSFQKQIVLSVKQQLFALYTTIGLCQNISHGAHKQSIVFNNP